MDGAPSQPRPRPIRGLPPVKRPPPPTTFAPSHRKISCSRFAIFSHFCRSGASATQKGANLPQITPQIASKPFKNRRMCRKAPKTAKIPLKTARAPVQAVLKPLQAPQKRPQKRPQTASQSPFSRQLQPKSSPNSPKSAQKAHFCRRAPYCFT